MKISGIDGETRIFGILGHPVKSSLSPAMHNEAYAALGINAVYLPLPLLPGNFNAGIAGLLALGVAGFNLTVPHKTSILEHLHHIEPEASAIGAVNTVRNDNGRLHGANTDGLGFLMSMQQDLGWDASGKTVLMLGAGGAARGIAYSLLGAGVARLFIANRTASRAQELAGELSARFSGCESIGLLMDSVHGTTADLVVNTTSIGMGDGASPLDLTQVTVVDGVADIVYTPAETPLLAQAKSLGISHTNGIGMLMYQGCHAFRYMTGQDAPAEVMRGALMAALAARA